jgi:hypothetical protein
MFPAIYFQQKQQDGTSASRIHNINFVAALIASSACLFSLLFLKNKPEHPPSFSSQDTKLDIVSSLKTIL